VCAFDEFQSDIAINQVLKATIYRMLRSSGYKLDNKTKKALKLLYQRFGEITLVENDLHRRLNTIKLQRHNMHYLFPIEICKFIISNTVFNEEEGKYSFLDFERDHQKMSALFENFVFNYYKRHIGNDWKVRKHEKILFHSGEGGEGIEYLPIMETDISLERYDCKVIIDTKFYQDPMRSRFIGSPRKFVSDNLYQLNAYLTHVARSTSHPCNKTAEGILLYPVLYPIPRLDTSMLGHRVRVESVDLNQEWREIGRSLVAIIDN